MTLEAFAAAHLISEVPSDLSLWHWTRSGEAAQRARAAIAGAGSLQEWGEGAVGRGLYLSTSAIDLIDKGQEVVYVTLREGTRMLMVDGELFGVGVPELMELLLPRFGWTWPRTQPTVKIDRAARPQELIPRLMDQLDLPACVYVFGFHLAVMVRDARCLRSDPSIDPARTVADYVKAHPKERPTLVGMDVVKRWLSEQRAAR